MRNITFDILGGAKMQRRSRRPKLSRVVGLLAIAFILYTGPVFAQGSIFGTVTNSDASTPVNGEMSFYGFLDDTDEEIRIETSVGAGYDAGNWFDDFQNYLTEAPGNPYDYYFYNMMNGEGTVLSGPIPNNSFQQEDIVLSAGLWPAAVTGITGSAISSSSLLLDWDDMAGMTFHVYRRLNGSNGSFFRIDDPTGSLANTGAAESYFVDLTTDGVSSYDYVIIADDGAGNLGQHSAIYTVSSAGNTAPNVVSVTPSNGSYVGGTNVTIVGTGFDVNGVTVDFNGSMMSTINSITPYEITGVSPPGATGSVDVIVTNTASGISSTLVGGFTYDANSAPSMNPIGPLAVDEGVALNVNVSASDLDGDIPSLFTSTPLPIGATFIDNGDGTGSFDWIPTFTDAGAYQVTFYAADAIDTVSELVDITVNEAGNQIPVLAAIGALQVLEGESLVQNITATDIDGTIPGLFAENLPTGATFVDSANGVGTLFFDPDTTQAGLYDVTFFASDGEFADTEIVSIEVLDLANQPPILTPLVDTTINEGDSLVLAFTATDPEGFGVTLSAISDIGVFAFVDSGNGVGVFNYGSDFLSAGTYQIIVTATDIAALPLFVYDTMIVTVADVNQAPIIDPIDPIGIAIGDTLTLDIFASDSTDPDPTAFLTMAHTGLPTNATFVDNGDNSATFTFGPDETQVGSYSVTFVASDNGALSDQITVDFSVVQENRAPVITVDQYAFVIEGEHLEMPVSATDPDGVIPTLEIEGGPENSTFVDNGDGTGLFAFDPSYVQAGLHRYTVRAFDGFIVVKKNILIQVQEAGNQPPVIDPATPANVTEAETLEHIVTVTDPDLDPLTLTVDTLYANMTFVDNGDNTGTFTFAPDYTQSGLYDVAVIATDGEFVDTLIITFTVDDAGPQPPTITNPVDSLFTDEIIAIEYTIITTDPDGVPPIVSAASMPAGAFLSVIADFQVKFEWEPGYGDAGEHFVRFFATDVDDASLVDSFDVVITVNDVNQVPYIQTSLSEGAHDILEADTFLVLVLAGDQDGTTPSIVLDTSMGNVGYFYDNVTFVDSGNGIGALTFVPDYSQGSVSFPGREYDFGFTLIDETDSTIQHKTATDYFIVRVQDANGPPIMISPITDTTIDEGTTLTFTISAGDFDTVPVISSPDLPNNATITGILPNVKSFSFSPDFNQAGIYAITLIADDQDPRGAMADTVNLTVTVVDAGNQAPLFTMTLSDTIFCQAGVDTNIVITAVDPEFENVTIAVDNVIGYATFVDSGNGVAVYSYSPNPTQVDSVYAIEFTLSDESGMTSQYTHHIRVVDVLRGDANYDNQLNMLDIIFILNFLYKDGSEPVSIEAADVNYDTAINVLDATYLINFFYRDGPPPPTN